MNESTLSAIFLTLKISSVATLAVFVPGVIVAYFLARRDTPFMRLVSTLLGLPMVIPPTAVGFLLLRGLANGPFDLLLTWKAAALASAIMALPLVVRTAKVAFEGVDPKLEMMTRTLGYGPRMTFFRTTVPLASKGLVAAAILGFTRAVGEFGATIIVAGNIPFQTQTLASAIFSAQEMGQEKEAYILIAIALALGCFSILAAEFLCRQPKPRHGI